jgi:hypothetical protein
MMAGLRLRFLGTSELTWRDLLVFVRNSKDLRECLAGPDSMWGLQEQLSALIADLLNVANWQRAGDENAKRPEPIPRPGVKKKPDGELIAQGTPMSIEDMDKMLGWNT